LNGEIVCVVCPTSCLVVAEWNETELLRIDRHQCKLAWDYIESEIFDPRRTVTTTLPVEGGRLPLVSVKTASPVPKDMVMDIMDDLADVVAQAPIKLGDVLVSNILDTGIDIVATRNVD
jgi:CxxC motif-containing protein